MGIDHFLMDEVERNLRNHKDIEAVYYQSIALPIRAAIDVMHQSVRWLETANHYVHSKYILDTLLLEGTAIIL